MITPEEQGHIIEHAYVPEHLPHYVTAISQTEPFLIDDFLVHVADTHFVFVGYPLSGADDESRMLKALDGAKERFVPDSFSVIAPSRAGVANDSAPADDAYYRLDLCQAVMTRKTENMLRRARGELTVSVGKIGWAHKWLIRRFTRTHNFDAAQRFIFKRVPRYAKCAATVVFEARNARGNLVAFDVAEFGARHYAFYMFNFRSNRHRVPGASDLLLAHIIEYAQAEGKRYINLGLGIDPGITFFKKKWGATPFLQCVSWMQEYDAQKSMESLFDQLS